VVQGRAQAVGVESITARILCRVHNSALSDTDSAAGDAFQVLKRAGSASAMSAASSVCGKWKVVRYEIDGGRLERWFPQNHHQHRREPTGEGRLWALSGSALDQPPDT